MAMVILALQVIFGIGSLVCFIMVLVKMFQNEAIGVAIASLLLIWCIGGLIAFIFGWMKADEWNIKPVMLAWTVFFVGGIILAIVGAMSGAPAVLPVG